MLAGGMTYNRMFSLRLKPSRFYLQPTKVLLLACLLGCTKSTSVSQGPDLELNKVGSSRLVRVAEKIPATHIERGRQFAIASQGPATSEAALEMFAAGGNIIDAAIAASFAVSVERPQSTGIGGGGFLLFYEAASGKTYAFDFREVAPLRAFPDMYLMADGSVNDKLSKEGVLAAGVPGLVAGLYEIHQRHGRLSWTDVLGPSIRLAEEGFEIYDHLANALSNKSEVLSKDAAAKKIFFDRDGQALQLGDRLVQTDLARTLRSIQSGGRDGFYRGWVGAALLNTFAQNGGLVERRDFDAYRMKEREVVRGRINDYEIVSMPPPSSGGAHVIQIINTLQWVPLRDLGPVNPRSIALTASSMQQAFADRASVMGDSDFVEVPLNQVTGTSYAREVFERISKSPRTPSSEVRAGRFYLPEESTETTHFSLMDAHGNAVASTQTINGWFGAGIVVPGTGIVLNNEMDDFTTKVGAANLYGAIGGEPNRIEPQKRPLSSMSPTIVLEPQGRRAVMALGSPSGTRIITCVALSLLNRLEYGLSLEDTQLALRYHHQWQPDILMIEKPGLPAQERSQIEQKGFQIEERDLGCSIQIVESRGNELTAISDPRGQGRARAR